MTVTLRTCRSSLGGEPPECCTPMNYDERARARAEAVDATTPRWCPSCGSKWIAPTFWPDASLDVWDCAEPECRAIFSGRGD